ncbi:MAG: hypothetical protein OEW75_17850 [Cyclobacteriaceae bacterium]|nr:hypothetical protein [Cyclobacteriaceae bacterium]
MKNQMKKVAILSAVFLAFLSFEIKAQNYKTAIGIRGGLYNGLTIKHFTGGNKAIEGLLASRWGGFNITGLLEFDNSISDVDGLSWFYGFGGHIGSWGNNKSAYFYDPNQPDTYRYTIIGLDGILGLEFTIPNAPFAFQLDWKPVFNLSGYNGFIGDGGAFSIRYAIK